jgi:hypothetical protein
MIKKNNPEQEEVYQNHILKKLAKNIIKFYFNIF